MINPSKNQGFTQLRPLLSREAAVALSVSEGLALPKGAGRYIVTSCDATGLTRIHLLSAFNAGRVTHKACCNPAAPVGKAPDSPSIRLKYAPNPALPVRELGTFKGFRQGLLQQFPQEPRGRYILQGLKNGLSRDTEIPYDVMQWLRWYELYQLDPVNPPPHPPTLNLLHRLEETRLGIAQFLQATAALESTDLAPPAKAFVTSAGLLKTPKPRLSPVLMYGRVIYSADWATGTPTPLSPEQTAALAWLLLEWSATKQPGSQPYKSAILKRFGMVQPTDIRISPHEWFRHIPCPDDQDQSAERQPLIDPYDGRKITVSIDDDDAVELLYRPPTSVTLPRNYQDLVSLWDWSDTIRLEITWPDSFLNLPEM